MVIVDFFIVYTYSIRIASFEGAWTSNFIRTTYDLTYFVVPVMFVINTYSISNCLNSAQIDFESVYFENFFQNRDDFRITENLIDGGFRIIID